MKGVRPHGNNGKWRVSIMVNAERMTKVCYSYEEAVQTAVYFRSILKRKHQGHKGDSMYTLNQKGQIMNEGQIVKHTHATGSTPITAATTQTFTFPATGQGVRIIEKDGQPWFVAKDVCEVLAIENNRDAVSVLDVDEKATVGISDTSSNGTTQRRTVTIISESGLYALIFRSNKPEARAFSKWVRAEVLPAIRRSGGYMVSRPDDTPEELLSRALIIAKEALDRKTLALDVAQPKADKYDKFLDTSGTLNLTQAAKQLGVSARTLSHALREGPKKWLFKKDKDQACMPMQYIIDKGYMVVVSIRKASTGQVFAQGRFTTKGMNALFEEFGRC